MSSDNSMYDGVQFVAHDLDTMRKQYEQLRFDHASTLRKTEALRNEVKAWRECRLWTDDYGNCKWYDSATKKLFEETNALNALESER